MTFLAPWLLLGLLATAIPLALHLRRSRRGRRMVFSTNQFFDQQFLRTARRARFQDLLLMLLRMAVLALLALALAQPLLQLPSLGGWLNRSGGARQVALVIDDSASMAGDSPEGVLLERAKRGALALVDQLVPSRGDRGTVVLAGLREAGPRVLFDEPTADLDQLRDAIRAIERTDLATDLDGAIDTAARAVGAHAGAAGGSGQPEVVVFSDFQETAWRYDEPIALAPHAGLMLVTTRAADEAQAVRLSVDAVQYNSARPLIGVPFSFRALVTNHSGLAASTTVRLVVADDTVSEQQVEVPANRSRVVRFTHRFAGAGWFEGRVELAGDAVAGERLTAARQRHFALQVIDEVRVLAVNGAPSQVRRHDALFFFRLALSVNSDANASDSPAPIHITEALPDSLNVQSIAGHDLIVLANVADLAPAALEALEHHVDRGGSLLITLGPRVQPERYEAWAGPHRLHGGLLPGRLLRIAGAPASETRAGAEPAFITWLDEHHPLLAGFAVGELGDLSAVRFYQRYLLAPAPDASVLMRVTGGEPLLIERRFGRGRVVVFASTLDRQWTDFPLQPTFVPWLYRMVGHLSQQAVSEHHFVRTGQIVRLPTAATQLEAVQIDGPDGRVHYPEPDPAQPNRGRADALLDTAQAGVYVVRASTARADAPPVVMFAANVSPEEYGRQALSREALTALMSDPAAVAHVDAPEQVAAAAQVARQGFGLWNVLLWIALAAALLEPWLANRLSRRRAKRTEDAMSRRDALPLQREPVAQGRPAVTAMSAAITERN